tara:strand:- start:528 stop:851 length:324 start_codon:yes stop_codon:yes gene_type:complete
MSLELELNPEENEINGDSRKFAQVFDNLIQDATKYPAENPPLRVGSHQADPEILIWFEDNGIGIPESELPRIFERFYRVEKGRSRDKRGTGLGLSIVTESFYCMEAA